jgi:hypothetical protein
MSVKEVINATSGSTTYDPETTGSESYEFTIDTSGGAPNANIKIFILDRHGEIHKPYLLAKASCTDWNGAVVTIKCKFPHANDSYTSIADTFFKNDVYPLNY